MGNQPSRPESLLGDLPDVVYKDSLGGGRFFKSSLCLHDEGGLVVVKTYATRPDAPDAKPYTDRLAAIREALARVAAPHVWPTQRVHVSHRAVHLVRQYMFSTLAARATSRPFLTPPNKRWLARQLLEGVAQAHAAGVCHGDIKAENVLVTSWEWVLLADFAPYKPTLLPADNPADFSFFFDTGGRRTCCLAPERFFDPGPGAPSPAAARAAPLTPAMDVFAAGCVLAELFCDGRPLFDYSSLLQFRRGAHDPAAALAALPPGLRALVAHMTQRDPAARLTAAEYLARFDAAVGEPAAAAAAQALGPLAASLLWASPDERAAAVAAAYEGAGEARLRGQGGGGGAAAGREGEGDRLRARGGEEGGRPEPAGGAQPSAEEAGRTAAGQQPLQTVAAQAAALLAEAQNLLQQVNTAPPAAGGGAATRASPAPPPTPAAATPPAASERQPAGPAAADADDDGAALPERERPDDGLVLMAMLLSSAVRGCRSQGARARLLTQLADCAARCGDDETRLQRALPHLVAAAAEAQAAAVRCAALRALPPLLAAVRGLPAGEARVFADYLLPSLSLVPAEAEAAVQAEYAAALGPLAARARALLEGLQRRGAGGGGDAPAPAPGEASFDADVAALRARVERAVHDVLVGPRVEPKLALLPRLAELAAALGRRGAADGLLPALLTLFNSREWEVRGALYEGLGGVCGALGPDGVAFTLLPFLERMLGDPDPAAAAQAADLLAALCARGLLRQRHALAAARRLCDSRLLRSGCTVVRAAAVRFVAAAAAQLGPAAARALLLPLVQPQLEHEPLTLEDPSCVAQALGGGYALAADSRRQQPSRSRPAAPAPGAGAPPPPAALPATSYALAVDAPHLLPPGTSHLSAALEQSPPGAGGAAGLVARARRVVALPPELGDAAAQLRPAGGAATPARAPSAQDDGGGWAGPEGGGPAGAPAVWYPRGVLVAHLAEHKKPISRLAALPDTPLFVSASADGAAKVWDCRRLERDISFRSRLTYSAHAAGVTAVAALAGGGGAQVATGGAEGSVHVWRVERAGERGGGILGVRQIDPGGRGAVLDLAACGPHVVAASLAVGGVAGWDLRAGGGAPAWALPAPPGEGAVGRFCCDPGEGPAWVVTGTTRGEVRLWDLRFLLPVARWRHPAGAGVAAMALAAAAPGELGVAAEGGPPAGPLLFVAAGEGEVGLWDAGDGACRAVLRVLRPGALEPERRQPPAALAAPAPAPRALDVMGRAKQLGLGDLAAPQPRAGAVRALLPTAGGQLLAAGADRVVRCWDCARPQHSYPVMAPPPGPRESEAALRDAAAAAASGGGGDPAAAAAGGPRWSFAYAARRVAGVAVVEETRTVEVCGEADREPYAAWGERAAALCHGQAVTDLAAVQGAAERLLVTAGLDGVVKVWR